MGATWPAGSWRDLDLSDSLLPYGVYAPSGGPPRVGVRTPGGVLDVGGVLDEPVFRRPSLNPFMELGPATWARTRDRLADLLSDPRRRSHVNAHLSPLSEASLHLPFDVADFVDFSSSLEHATALGRILRPGGEPLAANWRHLPSGYHGRAGAVVPSGSLIRRPCGQVLHDGVPVYRPTRGLDFEAEVGFVVGVPSSAGATVPAAAFAEHVFGLVLVNDWSARDIQAFEAVPLGPFLGKSFATSISPWVVPLASLESVRRPGPAQDPQPPAHLVRDDPWGLDIDLEVSVNGHVVSRPPVLGMYWTPDQQLAHLTSNGAPLRTGDLLASGTVSGSRPGERGSLIELTWNGRDPLTLGDGSRRTFLDDGDVVAIRGWARPSTGPSLDLGEVMGTIAPASAQWGEDPIAEMGSGE